MPQTIETKSILNKTKRRDPWFLDDYTLNPYSGCSFNCLFCYIRGSKYGEHMEDKLAIKSDAAELLEKRLQALSKKNKHGIIVLSSATDPYLHFEKEELITRTLLEIILQYKFPVHVITRSDLVVRDLDLLKRIDEAAILPMDLQGKLSHKAFVTFSFSTLDDDLARIFEPGATAPTVRLKALQETLRSGLHSGVSLMPLLPYINDTAAQLELLFSTFAQTGIRYIFPASITLFGNGPADSKTLVLRAVKKHFPHLSDKYEQLFGNSDTLPSYYQEAFERKMQEMCERYGLKRHL